MTTNSIDTDAVGTLITTEFGGPPQTQPVPSRNFQAYGAGVQNVYPYLYDPTDNVPPTDESEGALDLQEQEWVGEVEYLQANDPSFIDGEEISNDVVFENPLDTLDADAIDVGSHTVDYDAVADPEGGPFAYGVTEGTDAKVEDEADTEQVSTEPEPVVVSNATVDANPEAVKVEVTDTEAKTEAQAEDAEDAEDSSEASETAETPEVEVADSEPVVAPVVAPPVATEASESTPESTEVEGA